MEENEEREDIQQTRDSLRTAGETLGKLILLHSAYGTEISDESYPEDVVKANSHILEALKSLRDY